jgi:hypothetical protein
MAQAKKYTVTPLTDLINEDRRRAVSFLECPEGKDIDAKKVFDRLPQRKKQDVLNRFELWLDEGKCDKYFHGWPNNPQYKHCFVFKWRDAQGFHRLYGFLFNPRPETDPGYRACVLASHAVKGDPNTDPSELDGANNLRENLEVIKALKKAFPEHKKGK